MALYSKLLYPINASVLCAWEWSANIEKRHIITKKGIMGSDSHVIKYVQQLIHTHVYFMSIISETVSE